MARQIVFTEVAHRLRARIAAGEFATTEPLPAERALAEELGVNRLTLRKALELLEREQVVVRRQGCGTFVAANAGPRSQDSVLYVGDTQAHFYQGFYGALCAEAQDRHLAVTAFSPTDTAESLDAFRKLAVRFRRLICMESAWLLIQATVPDDVHVTRVSGFRSIDEAEMGTRPGYIISSDTFRAAKLAVRHLIELGHRRIALVEYGHRVPDQPLLGEFSPRSEMVLGCNSALQEAGLDPLLALALPDHPTEEFQDWQARCLRHQLGRMRQRSTGFVCAGDFRGGALLRVLRERRVRVPEDASVVGIGNTPWAEALDPQLCSVSLGEAQMARLALLLNAEPEPDTVRVVRVDPVLVRRRSTGPATQGRKL